MVSSHVSKSPILWKISGIATIASLIIVSKIPAGSALSQYHTDIMFWGGLLILALSGLLIKDALRLIHLQQEEIESLMGIKLALTSLIELKDPYTEGHSRNVRDLVRAFAEHLALSSEEVEEITLAAELHDIGKIGVSDSILNKPGKLNEKEFSEIKKHPVLGAATIQLLKGFERIEKMVRHHHEQSAGGGYPDGLSNDQIPFGAKVIAIVDSYDAMIHTRAYRKAMGKDEVLETMRNESGIHFDPELLRAFFSYLESGKCYSILDPVCGMSVTEAETAFQSNYQGKTYRFCSDVCMKEFTQQPEKYCAPNAREHRQ